MISLSNVSTFKIQDQCLIPQLMVSLQSITTTGHRKGIKLIRRFALDRKN